jgi:hypothetical protein
MADVKSSRRMPTPPLENSTVRLFARSLLFNPLSRSPSAAFPLLTPEISGGDRDMQMNPTL